MAISTPDDEFNEVLEMEGGENSSQVSPRTHDNSNTYRMGTVVSFVPRLISELSLDNHPVEWVWEGYLAKGHLTLFSAFWKSGKSTLVSLLLKSIQEGKSFAGQTTKLSRALIISEESEGIWARRRDELDLNLPSWVLPRPIKQRLNYQQWIDLLKKSAEFCKENEVDLVVIDTLSGFWNTRDENNASEVDTALLPINELLEKGIAVLLVHHFRKSGGQEGVASRGSGALGSRADILIEFSRLDSEDPNDKQRKLRSFSRFEETPTEVVIEMIDGEYVSRGTMAEVSKEGKLQNVLHILNSEYKLTATEICDYWDTDLYGRKPVKRTLQRYLDELLTGGRIRESGEKIVGKTKAPLYSVIDYHARQDGQNNARQPSTQGADIEANNARHDSGIPKDNKPATIEVAEAIFGVKAQPSSLERPISNKCNVCGGIAFWKNSNGEIVCATCHPDLKEGGK